MARFKFDALNERGMSEVTIVKNGEVIKTTQSAIMKARRAQARSTKKTTKKEKSVYQVNAEITKEMVNSTKVLKSLASYYRNGYKQWGGIFRTNIMSNKKIGATFATFFLKYKDVEKQLQAVEIERSRDQHQLIEKLGYLLDDLTAELQSLTKVVNESRVCDFFADHEMICGEGKRLGLTILIQRAYLALNDLDVNVKKISKLADERDVFSYKLNGSCARF